jgi:hypothetical protein
MRPEEGGGFRRPAGTVSFLQSAPGTFCRANFQYRSAIVAPFPTTQAGLSISDAVIRAKRLRLVCDTAAVRALVQQRSAVGSDLDRPGRFRSGNGAQKLAGCACGRKRRRRCALPAQSMTRMGLPGASELRGASCGVRRFWRRGHRPRPGAAGSMCERFTHLACLRRRYV